MCRAGTRVCMRWCTRWTPSSDVSSRSRKQLSPRTCSCVSSSVSTVNSRNSWFDVRDPTSANDWASSAIPLKPETSRSRQVVKRRFVWYQWTVKTVIHVVYGPFKHWPGSIGYVLRTYVFHLFRLRTFHILSCIFSYAYTLGRLYLLHTFSLLGEIASCSASDFAYSYSFLRSVVCRLSVVRHTRAPCLNCSTDLHAAWQVHLWGPVTHCVRWGPWPPGEGEIWGWTPA